VGSINLSGKMLEASAEVVLTPPVWMRFWGTSAELTAAKIKPQGPFRRALRRYA
jgi:hypothetical protein